MHASCRIIADQYLNNYPTYHIRPTLIILIISLNWTSISLLTLSLLALNPKGEQSGVIHCCPVTSEVPQPASDPKMYFSSQPITFVYG